MVYLSYIDHDLNPDPNAEIEVACMIVCFRNYTRSLIIFVCGTKYVSSLLLDDFNYLFGTKYIIWLLICYFFFNSYFFTFLFYLLVPHFLFYFYLSI